MENTVWALSEFVFGKCKYLARTMKIVQEQTWYEVEPNPWTTIVSKLFLWLFEKLGNHFTNICILNPKNKTKKRKKKKINKKRARKYDFLKKKLLRTKMPSVCVAPEK